MNTLPSDSGRVFDAPSTNWVYRVLPRALWPYAQLARWDRPIGWQLLMWPCFWSAALAANTAALEGTASVGRLCIHLALFFVGAVAMRGAGCTYNDIVDETIDRAVARTRSRPLPSGRVSRRDAKLFMALQGLVGLVVLLQFNLFTIVLGLLSLGFVAIYPFAKRFTDWPQFFLGMAFSWGAVMGWAAEFGRLSAAPVLLYLAAIAWTVGYDTIYAYQDREDDELVGVRSTARRFGERPKPWLVALYGLTLVLLVLSFALAGAGALAYLALAAAAVLLFYQILVLDIHDAGQCMILFRFNGAVGLIIFAGLASAFLLRWILSP
ncbi:4-hydroxybenzoate octaprenyltransferase [Rhizobium sp. Leaf384]|uniref:4-hydroxybenzoate octaprenyltransferase n=1 Tax=unclassified Rhizobium TaxID=2613769 RepID=UPI000714F85F|nr:MULTISPECIES: 4-hydroxybenzoate octaprenyltransferase [unclassified Rhizobium]KQS77352.1 4-hydroxybenzoate octaprenyltransferase [Rhizobium sp. Leaf383]KQS80739.1 4-hydroxybenzoate octaprenyltransferase [Rhizobium sp. Leaf384]